MNTAEVKFYDWLDAHIGQRVQIKYQSATTRHEIGGRLLGRVWNELLVEQPPPSSVSPAEIIYRFKAWSMPSVPVVSFGEALARTQMDLNVNLWAPVQGDRITEVVFSDDRRACVLLQGFSISYDDPNLPSLHDERPCPIHDEPWMRDEYPGWRPIQDAYMGRRLWVHDPRTAPMLPQRILLMRKLSDKPLEAYDWGRHAWKHAPERSDDWVSTNSFVMTAGQVERAIAEREGRPMIRQPFDGWKDETFTCPACAWSGSPADMRTARRREVKRFYCPSCRGLLLGVRDPGPDDVRQAAAEGSEEAQAIKLREDGRLIDAQLEEIGRTRLEAIAHLPSLPGEALNFMWDMEWLPGDWPEGRYYIMLRLGERLIWRERACYENVDRFMEFYRMSQARYGWRFKGMKATQASGYYLLGDSVGSLMLLDREFGQDAWKADDWHRGSAQQISDL